MIVVYFSLTYKIKVYFEPQVFSTRQNHEQMKGCIFGFFPSDLPIQPFPFGPSGLVWFILLWDTCGGGEEIHARNKFILEIKKLKTLSYIF
jgi:hypothetical protein